MASETQDELLRLIAERNTHTRRTPATLLLLRERSAAGAAGGAPGGTSSRVVRIDSAQRGHIHQVIRAMDEAFSERRSVVLELLSAPHPSLYALLKEASDRGTYVRPADPAGAEAGGDGRGAIPPACLIVVIAAREVVETQIRHPGFYSLFEVVECF